MKNNFYIISLFTLYLLGCEVNDPVPALGIEGVYLMEEVLDIFGEVQDKEDVGDNVYWLFEDRTFRKAQLKNEKLLEAKGTFAEIVPAEGSTLEGRHFELTFFDGTEIIEGCQLNNEILIQITPTQLVNEGHPCGEFNFYYDKFNID